MRNRKISTFICTVAVGLAIQCSGKPESIDGAKGVQLMSGSATWLTELKKLKNPAGIVPTGTNFSAANVIYKDPATFNEFFVFDDNASLILLSANPVYFMRIDSRDFKFKLSNELAQINAGKTGVSKALNSITYFKDVGDSWVEIYFTPTELGNVTSGTNKYRINDSNSTTAPDVDLYKLFDAAGSASLYAPIFADQQIADDVYTHVQAGKRRLVLTASNYVASPQVSNVTTANLNFSAMIGTNLSITDALLGAQDINFEDRYKLTRDFGAFFSLPIGNSRASGRNCLSQFDGIVVIIRGDMSPFKSFLSTQGVNMDATPVTATKNIVAPLSAPFCTYVAPSDIVVNEVAPQIAAGNDLIELYVQKATNLSGMTLYEGTTLLKTFPSVQVSAGDYIVIHINQTGTDETLAKNQSVDAGNIVGAWDFWSSDTGLTGTDNGIVLKSATGEILDGLLFGNYSNAWTGPSSTTTSGLFAAGRWKTAGDTFVESDVVNNFPGDILAADSFQRKTDGYVANVSNADWMVAPMTIGTTNNGYVQTQVASTVLTTATAIDANHLVIAMNRPITFAAAPSFTIAGLTITDAQYSATYGYQNLITLTTATHSPGPYMVVITSPGSVLDFYGTSVSSTNPLERANFNGYSNLTATGVIISEVQVSGTVANDEFVELYNPTNAPISLNTWCLRTKSANSSTSSAYHTFAAVSIPAYGYYLVGGASYAGAETADATRSAAANLSTNNAVILGNAGCAAPVDVVAWGGHTVNNFTSVLVGSFTNSNPPSPDDFQSVERKNNANATELSLSTGGADELKGNGWDSGINNVDFILRTTSKPQNSTRTETPAL